MSWNSLKKIPKHDRDVLIKNYEGIIYRGYYDKEGGVWEAAYYGDDNIGFDSEILQDHPERFEWADMPDEMIDKLKQL